MIGSGAGPLALGGMPSAQSLRWRGQARAESPWGLSQNLGSFNRVIRRLLDVRSDLGPPVDLIAESSDAGSVTFRQLLPPGADRDAALVEMKDAMEAEASRLEAVASELRELVALHDPVELVASVAVPGGMGVLDDDAVDDAPTTFGWDAKVEYLVGLVLSVKPGTDSVPLATTRRVVQLLGQVFEAAAAASFLESSSQGASGRSGLDAASFLMRQERLLDRMAGYSSHLEAIDAEVFDRHRQLYVSELGFCPSDATRLVRRHVAWVNREFQAAAHALAAAFDDDVDPSSPAGQRVALSFRQVMDAPYLWTPELLAESSGLPMSEVAALLSHLSNGFECQPDFRLPSDENLARYRPLVRLYEDTYLAALPWSLAHGIHGWIEDHLHRDVQRSAPRLLSSTSKLSGSAAGRADADGCPR